MVKTGEVVQQANAYKTIRRANTRDVVLTVKTWQAGHSTNTWASTQMGTDVAPMDLRE